MAAATIAGPDDNGAWRTTTREPAPESLPNTLTSSQDEASAWSASRDEVVVGEAEAEEL